MLSIKIRSRKWELEAFWDVFDEEWVFDSSAAFALQKPCKEQIQPQLLLK